MVAATTAILTARSTWRVLVVDDSAVIRQAISKMLRADFDVVVANDGEAGWEELAKDREVAVLITDIEMPRLDGYAFICRVRASDEARIRDLPVIVITGADDEETRTRAYACGATDFITKPLNLVQLQACIQAYMRFEQPLAEGGDDLDSVSGLPGRRALLARGAELWASHDRRPLALLMVALDRVRVLYREYGDERMDEFVRHAVAVIRAAMPTGSYIARLGGAEFGIILGPTTATEALAAGQHIVAALAAQPAGGVTLTASVGVSVSDDATSGWESLQTMAADRLKRAVASGGNQATASALSDTIGGAEELVLDAVALPPDAEPDRLGEEAELVAEALSSVDAYTPPEAMATRSLISLDRALWLLADGRADLVEPHLDPLLNDMIPLLEFLDGRRRLGLRTAIESIRRSVLASGRDA